MPCSSAFFSKAGEGIRTLDIQLGKLSLCQLSYARKALLRNIVIRTGINRQDGQSKRNDSTVNVSIRRLGSTPRGWTVKKLARFASFY